MDVIISGQVTAILPAQTGVSQRSGQPWTSQEYVLCHEPGQYPRSVCFRIFGEEKIRQANIQMGEQITIHLNIDAKQGQKGYFNTIDCWKVERPQMQQAQPQYAPQSQYQQPAAQAPFPPQQPMQQAPVQQPQQGGLPFPPAQ